MEPIARQAYVARMATEGSLVTVREQGLLVSAENSYFATSTDGIITDSLTRDGVLEIKCPMSDQPISYLAYLWLADLPAKFARVQTLSIVGFPLLRKMRTAFGRK